MLHFAVTQINDEMIYEKNSRNRKHKDEALGIVDQVVLCINYRRKKNTFLGKWKFGRYILESSVIRWLQCWQGKRRIHSNSLQRPNTSIFITLSWGLLFFTDGIHSYLMYPVWWFVVAYSCNADWLRIAVTWPKALRHGDLVPDNTASSRDNIPAAERNTF